MNQSLTASATKIINAPIKKVFEAWVKPEIMKKWYSPPSMTTSKAESDPKVGGNYSVTMAAGGQEYTCTGKYLEIDEPHKLVFTWDDNDSVVTVGFKALEDDKTEVSLTHIGFVDDASRGQHEEGWVGCLDSLATSKLQ